jgi:hypothetical protein
MRQGGNASKFPGFLKKTKRNPSTPHCLFPVRVQNHNRASGLHGNFSWKVKIAIYIGFFHDVMFYFHDFRRGIAKIPIHP